VIRGFLEQAAAVWVGVKGLIERAVTERTNFIIEGAHVVPGIIESKVFGDAIVVQMVIAVEDEYQHRCHFEMREVETEGTRTLERYLENFDSIRRIQEYILGLAEKEKVKVFSSYNIDATVGSIIQYVIDEIFGGRHDF
jgi:2-phosphoglycerate kinase